MCALSPEEVARFQAAAAHDRRSFVFTFTLATGMRPGEVQALQWKDCDLEAGSVAVRRNLVHLKGGRWEFGDPKTPQSRRTIPLPRSVARELVAHRAAQAALRLRLKGAYEDLDLVFASETGGPLDGQNLAYRTLKPILKAAGLPARFRWYDCRHSCATLLLAAGENPKVVSERLGHATVAFTLDRYAHVLPGMQKQASRRLESLLYSG
jgi:integrase